MAQNGDQAKSLYEILNVEKTASQAEIKKAYRVLCLQLHPDKNPDQEAKSKFQSLQKVYAVLGDTDKRAAYDETGITDEDLLGEQTNSLFNYFSRAFKKVTPEDLDTFFDEYRGSEEETKDLINLYQKHEGDMEMVFQCAMCSDESIDSHRFMDTIKAAIHAGEVQEYRAFKTWCKGVQKRPRPADPLKKRSTKGRDAGPSSALVASITQKSKANYLAFMDNLESKYATGAKGKGAKGKRAARAEPTDEEFEAIQARILQNKAEAKPAAGKAAAKPPNSKGNASKNKKKSSTYEVELVFEDGAGSGLEESLQDSGSEGAEEEVVVTVKRDTKGNIKGRLATKQKADAGTGTSKGEGKSKGTKAGAAAGERKSPRKSKAVVGKSDEEEVVVIEDKGQAKTVVPSKRKGKALEEEEEEEVARPKAKGKGSKGKVEEEAGVKSSAQGKGKRSKV